MPFNEYSKQKVCYDTDAFISTAQIIFGTVIMIVGAFLALNSPKTLSFLSTLHGEKTLAIEMLQGTNYIKYVSYAIFITGVIMFTNGALTLMLRSLHKAKIFIMLSISASTLAIALVILYSVAYFNENIKRSINEEVRVKLVRHYHHNDGTNYNEFSQMVDRVQLDEKCCGSSGQTDYNRRFCGWTKSVNTGEKTVLVQIPLTCCSFKTKGDSNATDVGIWKNLEDERCPIQGRLCAEGCIEKAKKWWEKRGLYGLPVVSVVIVISTLKSITSGTLYYCFRTHELEIY